MILTIIIIIFLVFMAIKYVKILRSYEKGVVERLGKYNRTVSSGVVVLIPFLENLERVDLREQVVDVPPQEVITKDNTIGVFSSGI